MLSNKIMRRKISSAITNLYKTIVLMVLSIIIIVSLIKVLLTPGSIEIFLSSLSMLLGFFIFRWILSWKKVEIADKGIYVSSTNFFNEKEIFIPFEQIETAEQSFWMRGSSPEFVNLKLLVSTSFGKKIWFMPKARFNTFSKHPIVEEINQLTAQNKGFIN